MTEPERQRNRSSSVEQLPPDILEQLQALLRDPRVTQLDATRQINVILEQQGAEDRVSKSAVNRYAVRMERIGKRMRESRQVAEMWIGKLGAEPQGKLGNLVNEILRTLSFDAAQLLADGHIDEESLPGVIEQLKHLALATYRLERSATENVQREALIRKQAKEEAAEAAEGVVRKAGLSDDAVAKMRAAIMGTAE